VPHPFCHSERSVAESKNLRLLVFHLTHAPKDWSSSVRWRAGCPWSRFWDMGCRKRHPQKFCPEGAGAFRLLNTRATRSGLQARTGSPGWYRLLPNCSASLSLQGIESPSARFSGRYRIAPVARLGLPERQNIPSPLQRAKEDNLSPNRKFRNSLRRAAPRLPPHFCINPPRHGILNCA